MDPYKKLGLVRNQDGTIGRLPTTAPAAPAVPDGEGDPLVLSKDVPLNTSHNTSLRLYLPNCHQDNDPRLPIIINYHGGGFVLRSVTTPIFHDHAISMAAEIPALFVSVEYRLAPEHPLPAAYEDAVESLLWVRDQTDPWVRLHGDLSQCYLLGNSSGGNIVYHAGVRSLSLNLTPLTITGLILNQPFFGGEERTESELRMKEDKVIPLDDSDVLWKVSLPEGADRDHEFCNPVKGTKKEDVSTDLPRCLVRAYIGDPLIDRQREFTRWLEGRAKSVVAKMDIEGFHAVEIFQKDKADEFLEDVKRFILAGEI